MEYPEDLYYSKEHNWVRLTGNRATVGITDFAQQEMGEILYTELPDEGSQVEQGDIFGTLESSKTVAELFSPVSGEVISINKDLEEEPSLVNDDPYGKGWLMVLELDDPSELQELFSAVEYEDFLEKQEESSKEKKK
ncbi:MAG: glycine cleavage system protein H [Deltaproteobacteria bacterium RBG_13_51_10]|nr:MAG: glycine cleavage system protein H [Deltaproteobacteria bacterium RBG_13_51_10]